MIAEAIFGDENDHHDEESPRPPQSWVPTSFHQSSPSYLRRRRTAIAAMITAKVAKIASGS